MAVGLALCALAATVIVAPDTATRAVVPFAMLLISEAACVGVSLARFGLMPATHCYSAKAYAIALFATFAAVLACDAGPGAVWALAVLGLAANTEVLAILIGHRKFLPAAGAGEMFRRIESFHASNILMDRSIRRRPGARRARGRHGLRCGRR